MMSFGSGMCRLVLALAVGTAACGPTSSPSDDIDASPIRIKEPPAPRGEDQTHPACGGVTVAGQCADGAAEKCDIDAGQVRRLDCRAMDRECVIDRNSGAACESLALTSTEGPCGNGLDSDGICTPDGKAVWCDFASGVTQLWNCQGSSTCGVDVCADGAACCGGSNQCAPCPAGLDVDGECSADGLYAHWCDNNGCEQVEDCGALGVTCGPGAFEAQCIDPECEDLGFGGECLADGSGYRYCDVTVKTVSCTDGKQCAILEPDGIAYCGQGSNPCPALGAAGECQGDTLRYCSGDELVTEDCAASSETCFSVPDCPGADSIACCA